MKTIADCYIHEGVGKGIAIGKARGEARGFIKGANIKVMEKENTYIKLLLL